ncbi:hypothetical protein TUMEXPCC7403_14405 [Tumidithrix helvetica PCC 7403]
MIRKEWCYCCLAEDIDVRLNCVVIDETYGLGYSQKVRKYLLELRRE